MTQRPIERTFQGAIAPFRLPKHLSDAVREFAHSGCSTIFVVLLTAFAVLIYRYTGHDELVIATVAPACRMIPEVQKLIGYFLNPVALRIDLSGDQTIAELLAQSTRVVSEAISNSDVRPDPSRHPFFNVAISQEPPIPDVGPNWDLTPMDADSGACRWDLYLVLDDRPGGMIGRVQYNLDRFSSTTVARTVRDYSEVLDQIITGSGRRLSSLGRVTGGPV
jgi:non-ribosomal peptide synthetase component F